MGLIKSALLVGGGIYAVKAVTKSHHEKKKEKQKNQNNIQDMYPPPHQQQHYYQPQYHQQYQQQQRVGQGEGYDYTKSREGSNIMQDYGHINGQPRGQFSPPSWAHPESSQSQYRNYADGPLIDGPPAYAAYDEKKRLD
ncbi:hypothetical protein TSTA_095430 [Talaromyces stipitatus ATCC 10500]|uniref:Uncharacterized protein n=1 Tax=Talaromyces stipitatus (strain ATCC 10500 / CBS 375.48 / QM 6759 / NRRL 1006) TaxID=441959 RepID=B8M3C2_TALSN|nr:uncharacterized protein TSTA_095430 [Talaromyces stipitatus ATCC 10500]EED22294.1 hypothetical protein TSTA_095430 [Talaromyces stipitatus ATCC 10500]